MTITYCDDAKLTRTAFVDLYRACSLGARRPLDEDAIVDAMMTHGNLTITAWEEGLVVGIARTLTDFLYVGYLADLAVRESHQQRGIGVGLIRETQNRMGQRAHLVLLAAPAAADYYPRIGFTHAPNAWLLKAGESPGA